MLPTRKEDTVENACDSLGRLVDLQVAFGGELKGAHVDSRIEGVGKRSLRLTMGKEQFLRAKATEPTFGGSDRYR
jgi:hypothetical protein